MRDRDEERFSLAQRLVLAVALGLLASMISVGHSEPETSNETFNLAPIGIVVNTVDTSQEGSDVFAVPDDASAPANSDANASRTADAAGNATGKPSCPRSPACR
jgi:hypothetical protein